MTLENVFINTCTCEFNVYHTLLCISLHCCRIIVSMGDGGVIGYCYRHEEHEKDNDEQLLPIHEEAAKLYLNCSKSLKQYEENGQSGVRLATATGIKKVKNATLNIRFFHKLPVNGEVANLYLRLEVSQEVWYSMQEDKSASWQGRGCFEYHCSSYTNPWMFSGQTIECPFLVYSVTNNRFTLKSFCCCM